MENYWTFVRTDLMQLKDFRDFGDPAEWKESVIRHFLDKVEERIKEIAKEDEQKAEACYIKYIAGKEGGFKDTSKRRNNGQPEDWTVTSFKTFKRIFQPSRNSKPGGAHKRVKNIFAVFLGYDNAFDYYHKRNNPDYDVNDTEDRPIPGPPKEEDKSDVAFSLIKKRLLQDFTDLGFLILGIRRQAPTPYKRKQFVGESAIDYLAELKRHYQTYLDGLKMTLENYPLSKATFDAHSINLSDSNAAVKLQTIYEGISQSRIEFFDLIKMAGEYISNATNKDEINKEISYKYQDKLIISQVGLAHAVSEFMLMLDDHLEIDELVHAVKAAGFSVSEKEPSAIAKELLLQVSKLYSQRSTLIAKRYNLPEQKSAPGTNSDDPDKLLEETNMLLEKMYTMGGVESEDDFIERMKPQEKRKIDRKIRLPGIKRNRELIGRPPRQLTNADYFALAHKELDTTETDPVNLLVLIFEAYCGFDEAAIIYYLEKALEAEGLNKVQKQYLTSSLELMNQPDKYGDSMGIMIIKLLEQGAFGKAAMQVGDIIFKINNEAIHNQYDIPKLLSGKNSDHFIEFYREGKYKSGTINSNLSAGAEVSPLVTWDVIRI